MLSSSGDRTHIWVAGVLIVALAFGLGYGIRHLAEDDPSGPDAEPSVEEIGRVGVTYHEAASVPIDTTRSELLRRFRGKPYATRADPRHDLECYVYVVSDRLETGWSFCFRKHRLRSSSTSPL